MRLQSRRDAHSRQAGAACPETVCDEAKEPVAIGVLGIHPTVNSRRSNVNFDAIRGSFFIFTVSSRLLASLSDVRVQ